MWREGRRTSQRFSWAASTSAGQLSDQQLRDFNVAEVGHTTANACGKWLGTNGFEVPGASGPESLGGWQAGARRAEKRQFLR